MIFKEKVRNYNNIDKLVIRHTREVCHFDYSNTQKSLFSDKSKFNEISIYSLMQSKTTKPSKVLYKNPY